MSDIELVVFDLADVTGREADHTSAALAETLSALGLPIPLAEIESLRDRPGRDAIEHLLLRYSPEQAQATVIDPLFADLNRRLAALKKNPTVQPLEGAEGVFRWLRQRGIKVALTAELDRKSAGQVIEGLKWNAGVVDAVVCRDDVRAGPPAPFLIFRAMELTGVPAVGRVAAVGGRVRNLEAGATAGVGMNVGVLSGAEPKEKLEAAPHTHLIESVRKFPPLLAAPAQPPVAEETKPPEAAAPAAKPPEPPPPEPPPRDPGNPMGPGFTMGSGL